MIPKGGLPRLLTEEIVYSNMELQSIPAQTRKNKANMITIMKTQSLRTKCYNNPALRIALTAYSIFDFNTTKLMELHNKMCLTINYDSQTEFVKICELFNLEEMKKKKGSR